MQTKTLLYALGILSVLFGSSTALLEAGSWQVEKGYASYYGKRFAGRPTANGETFSPREMTAAHRKLPLGTKVLVENPETGQQIEVKINDRGPYIQKKRRIIDLSRTAARSLGIIERGVHPVKITVTEAPIKMRQEDREYEIQIGAFTDRQEAKETLISFDEKPYPTFMQVRQGPRGKYYRVRAGPFDTLKRAQRIARNLKQQGHAIFIDVVPDAD